MCVSLRSKEDLNGSFVAVVGLNWMKSMIKPTMNPPGWGMMSMMWREMEWVIHMSIATVISSWVWSQFRFYHSTSASGCTLTLFLRSVELMFDCQLFDSSLFFKSEIYIGMSWESRNYIKIPFLDIFDHLLHNFSDPSTRFLDLSHFTLMLTFNEIRRCWVDREIHKQTKMKSPSNLKYPENGRNIRHEEKNVFFYTFPRPLSDIIIAKITHIYFEIGAPLWAINFFLSQLSCHLIREHKLFSFEGRKIKHFQ